MATAAVKSTKSIPVTFFLLFFALQCLTRNGENIKGGETGGGGVKKLVSSMLNTGKEMCVCVCVVLFVKQGSNSMGLLE